MQAVDKHNKYQHFTYDIFKYPQIADSLICGVFASLALTQRKALEQYLSAEQLRSYVTVTKRHMELNSVPDSGVWGSHSHVKPAFLRRLLHQLSWNMSKNRSC